jgi:hypothetical protein
MDKKRDRQLTGGQKRNQNKNPTNNFSAQVGKTKKGE